MGKDVFVMNLVVESPNLQDFLEVTAIVDFHHPAIAALVVEILRLTVGQE